MKKFISMVMAAAMVVSLVPATAFAANTATFKVVSDKEYTESEAADVKKGNDKNKVIEGPELQLKLKDVDSKQNAIDDFEVTLDFNNAELSGKLDAATIGEDNVVTDSPKAVGSVVGKPSIKVYVKEEAKGGDDSVKLVVLESKATKDEVTTYTDLADDDVIAINLKELGLVLTKASKNTKATVEVGGDFGDSDAMTFAAVLDSGLKVTLKKVAEVAEGEDTELEKDLKIEPTVSDFVKGQIITVKVSNGFEFSKYPSDWKINSDKDEITYTFTAGAEDLTIAADALKIDAADAKVGAVAKLTVKAKVGTDKDEEGKDVAVGFKATADAVEAAKVVGSTVTLSVDEDEDLPVIYSGVDTDNTGITDDSDHMSLEVNLKEATKGALDVKKAFTMTLPDGVYVTDIKKVSDDGVAFTDSNNDLKKAFEAAYEKGDQEKFEFARKTFKATDRENNNDEMDLKFQLELIAEPNFEGDVTLTLGGDAFDKEQTVKIAKFVKPYTVEAQANDLIIDYRNTKVPTNIVVKEAEDGLWSDKSGEAMRFVFNIDRFDDDAFENDAKYTVDDKSGLEVKANSKGLGFKVTDESDDTAATVTISDISLYMSRSIAAGAYDLELITDAGYKMMTGEKLLTSETDYETSVGYTAADYRDWKTTTEKNNSTTTTVFEADSFVVKEGFVNVITAGRDQDDASFTKKVVVPVGEKYLIAGEEQVALDVPAYISAAGYTMLPVRAVATALGINNNNVLWNQASRTVTILYGQRIITMVAGQKVVTVNGNTIPASATVQIKDGRTFLPMRDLATALGVTDITWDAATKTATMNGNQNK